MNPNNNNNSIWMYVPSSTPHLIALFFAQFPFILSEEQIQQRNYKYYPISENTLDRHFVWSMKNWNEKRYHTLLTYSLIHYNWDHFQNNFISIALCGTHIIKNAGSNIFWITYLFGTISGGLSSAIEYFYHNHKSRITQKIETVSENKNVLNKIKEPINDIIYRYGNKAIDTTFKTINENNSIIGSSSAVYGLYAFDFALTIDQSKNRFYKFWRKYILLDNSIQITSNEKLQTLFDLFSIYTGFKRIQHDLQYIWFEKTNRTKFDHLIVTSPDNIAHSGHVGGFLAGLITYFIWRLRKIYKQRNMSNVDFQ